MTDDSDVNKQKESDSDILHRKLTSLYVLGFFVFLIGPLIALLVGGLRVQKHIEYRTLMKISAIFLVLHFILLFAFFIPNFYKARTKARVGEFKSCAHDIQLVLERYQIDNLTYPEDPHLIEDAGYPPDPSLRNPFTGKPLEIIPYDPDDHFTSIGYIPFVFEGVTVVYYLITFGTSDMPGQDVDKDGIPDHVIMVLGSGCDCRPDHYDYWWDMLDKAHDAGVVLPIEKAFKDIKWMWK